MAVFFHFNEVRFPLKGRRHLKAFITGIFQREGFVLRRLDYIFCTDAFLLEINQKYLEHDTLTDVITFDMTENPVDGVTAEIYISAARIKENAGIFGVPFDQELCRVMFHGAFHLCGYGDKSEDEKKRMREKENEALERYIPSS